VAGGDKEGEMFDQEIYGSIPWQQCQDRCVELRGGASAGRAVEPVRKDQPGRREYLHVKLGDALISIGLRLGGRIPVTGSHPPVPAYR
jgi:hypothetical protein